MSNGRRVAANALLRVEKDGAYSNLVLNDAIKSASLDKSEASFVSALFYGVLERKITLDYYIKKLSKLSIKKISPLTLMVLRTGLYQILYMDKIPDSAAVNEAVKIIKHSKEARSSGFVNAVLRNALRDLPSLPKPESAEDISVIYSCDVSLCEKLIEYYGIKNTIEILSCSLEKSKLYIRVNPLKTSVDELVSLLSADGIMCEKTELEYCLCLKNSGSIETNKLYKQGYFHVQDISSQICATTLDAKEGHVVLDTCAAPGGKTFTIAENMKNKGALTSCDLHPHRVKLIADGAGRLGLSIINAFVSDASVLVQDWVLKFDRVLCDVPCSGSGIISRKPDIKYKDFSSFSDLTDLQYKILSNGFKYLKTGGKIVYSTCSILRDENESVIEKFLSENPDAAFLSMHTYLPHIDNTDGFFIAVLEKRG